MSSRKEFKGLTRILSLVILLPVFTNAKAWDDEDSYYSENTDLQARSIPVLGPFGDSASNFNITNNASSKTIKGLVIDKYNCTDPICTTSCSTVSASSRVVMWNPISFSAFQSMTVGQNYLYNLLTILNNAALNNSTAPCSAVSSNRYLRIVATTTSPQGVASFTSNGIVCLQRTSSNCTDTTASWNPSGTISLSG